MTHRIILGKFGRVGNHRHGFEIKNNVGIGYLGRSCRSKGGVRGERQRKYSFYLLSHSLALRLHPNQHLVKEKDEDPCNQVKDC